MMGFSGARRGARCALLLALAAVACDGDESGSGASGGGSSGDGDGVPAGDGDTGGSESGDGDGDGGESGGDGDGSAGDGDGGESGGDGDGSAGDGDGPGDGDGSADGERFVSIENPSFESPSQDPGEFETGSAPPGWEGFGSLNFGARTIGVFNPHETTGYVDPIPEGQNVGVAFLQDSLEMPTEGGLEQILEENLEANTDYALIVEVGNLAIVDGHPYDFDGFPGYRIELLAGGEVIAQDDDSLAPEEGRFETSTTEFSSGLDHPRLGESLGIRLINLDAAAGIEVNFDDVRLIARPIARP